MHAANKPLDADISIDTIAMRTPGFSGADLSNLLNEAAILAGRRNKVRAGGAGGGGGCSRGVLQKGPCGPGVLDVIAIAQLEEGPVFPLGGGRGGADDGWRETPSQYQALVPRPVVRSVRTDQG